MNAKIGGAEGIPESILSEVWPGGTCTAEPLEGGMTNRNWKVNVVDVDRGSTRSCVVQLQLPDSAALTVGIRRDNQSKALDIAHQLGIGPEVIAKNDVEPRYLVTEFLEACPPTSDAARSNAVASAGRALAALHTGTHNTDMEGYVSDPFQGTRWIHKRAMSVAPELVSQFDWSMDILATIEGARGPYVPTLLHSDLSPGNVLVLRDRVVVIDWEYAGSGDRYYDLGDFAEKWALCDSDERHLVCGYGDEDPQFCLSATRAYRFVSMLREGFWAVLAGTTGFLEFDHDSYARTCLSRMSDIAQSAMFEEAIEALRARRDDNE